MGCTSGASSKKGGGGIFKPAANDEISQKISEAHTIKISKSAITLKDQNGKTQGMIRGIERLNDMPSNRRFDISKQIRSAGGLSDGVKISDIFVSGGKKYVLNNMYSQRINKITGENPNKNKVLKNLEKAGFIIVNYDKL